MKFLFLHQNFPGQFKLIARELAGRGNHEVVAVGSDRRDPYAEGISYHSYDCLTGPPQHLFPPAQLFGDQTRRGRSAADVLTTVREEGFEPDTIVAHPGWGDALFVRELFPAAHYVAYLEFYYRASGSDVDFDPEFPTGAADIPFIRLRNASNLFAFADAAVSVTPTQWQASLFPDPIRNQLVTLHEGIDTQVAAPRQGVSLELPTGEKITADNEVVTFVARSLEPYRGFHVFMRALPALLRMRPKAQVLIAGRDRVSYGRRPVGVTSWREAMLDEIGAEIDSTRVHFLGTIPYEQFIQLLNVSTVHVYLTYPFILSWSLLEAMACGCAVVCSATGPVLEVIVDGQNGRLVPFFDREKLVATICELLDDAPQRRRLSAAARDTVVDRYDFRTRILPPYAELLRVRTAKD